MFSVEDGCPGSGPLSGSVKTIGPHLPLLNYLVLGYGLEKKLRTLSPIPRRICVFSLELAAMLLEDKPQKNTSPREFAAYDAFQYANMDEERAENDEIGRAHV